MKIGQKSLKFACRHKSTPRSGHRYAIMQMWRTRQACMLHLSCIHYLWSFSFKWRLQLLPFLWAVLISVSECSFGCDVYVKTFEQKLCYNDNNAKINPQLKGPDINNGTGCLVDSEGHDTSPLWGFDYVPVAEGWGNLILTEQSSLPPKQRHSWGGGPVIPVTGSGQKIRPPLATSALNTLKAQTELGSETSLLKQGPFLQPHAFCSFFHHTLHPVLPSMSR